MLSLDGAKKLILRLRGALARDEAFGGDYKACIEMLEKLSLADIGTSQEELKQIRTHCCKAYAKKVVEKMRQGHLHKGGFVSYVRLMLHEEGVSPEDIGSSEEELVSFEK